MNQPIKVIFVCTTGHGHLFPTLILAELLAKKGHECAFLIRESMAKYTESKGFKVFIIPEDISEDMLIEKKFQLLNDIINYDDESLIGLRFLKISQAFSNDTIQISNKLPEVIESFSPDIIIASNFVKIPLLDNLNKPWVHIHTPSPHGLYNLYTDLIPPSMSGLPLDDKSGYEEFASEYKKGIIKEKEKFYYEFFRINQCDDSDGFLFTKVSPYLNIYFYPEEMDYSNIFKLPDNYLRLDPLIREEDEKIPESFLLLPGKLIYFSLGSWLFHMKPIMDHLLKILSKMPHKIIVSCGTNIDPESLPSNMWGKQFLRQIGILKQVNLYITHGGQNSIMESLYYGKPMIVAPLFFDQLDNAQRIQELGLGKRINSLKITEEEMREAIDLVLSDEIQEKTRKIGEKIRNSNTKEIYVNKIEELVEKYRHNLA